MKKDISYITIILLLLAYIFIYPSMINKETEEPKDAQLDPYVMGTIKEYQENLANNNWEKAGESLTGEALLLHQRNTSNIQDNQTYKADLYDFKVKNFTQWEEVVIVDTSSTISNGENSEINNIRYNVIKLNGAWKIFGQERLIEGLPEGLNEEHREQAEEVVKRTIINITTGKWRLAVKDMTGIAKQEAERTISIGQKPIISDIDRLTVKTLQIDEELGWVWVNYNIINEMKQQSNIEMIFKVKNILGQWKIHRTEVIKL